jgi:hypothetical protein
MAKLTTIVRRTDSSKSAWCLLHSHYAPNFFTQEEIDKVLTPYIEYAGRREGLIPNSWHSAIDANTAIFSVEFDTVEHAEEARTLLSQGSTVPVVKAKHDLLDARRKAFGLTYTVTTHVSP